MKKILFTLLLFSFLTPTLKSTAPECTFERYTSIDGLPNNNVASLYVDSRGYVWACTWFGVSRFDGHNFKNYYVNQLGEPVSHSRFESVVEDKVGNLWFRTYDNHIYRFNRNTEQLEDIHLLLPELGNIQVNRAGELLCDSHGNIWIDFQDYGLVRIYTSGDGTVMLQDFLDQQVQAIDISHIIEDNNANIWVATNAGDIFKYTLDTTNARYIFNRIAQLEDYIVEVITIENNICISTGSDVVFYNIQNNQIVNKLKIHEVSISALSLSQNKEDIYIGTTNGRLGRFTIGAKTIKMIDALGYKSKSKIRSIHLDSYGLVWFYDAEAGVNRYSPSNNDIKHFEQKNYVSSFYTDSMGTMIERNGKLWIKFNNVGFGCYDRVNDVIDPFYNDYTKPNNYMSNGMVTFTFSSDNVMWFSSYAERGVQSAIFEPNHNNFLLLDNQELRDDVRALMRDNNNNIWVGTRNGRLYCFDSEYKLKHLYTKEEYEGLDNIYCITEDNESNIWLGTKGYGAFKLTPVGEGYSFSRFTYSDSNPNSIGSNQIYSIIQDDLGHLWFGSYGDGISMLESPNSKFFYNNRNSFVNYPKKRCNRVRHLAVDGSGNIMIATAEGLLVFDPKQDPASMKFSLYQQQANNDLSLSNNNIIHILRDSQDRMWLSTYGGGLNLVLGNKQGQAIEFKHYPNNYSAVGDIVYASVEDENGVIWTLSGDGIMRLDETGVFTNYSRQLLYNTPPGYNEATATLGTQGLLLFGTNRGVQIVDVNSDIDVSYDYKLRFTDLEIQNEIINVADNSALNRSISESNNIKLAYDYTLFTINFSSLNFDIQDQMSYMYMLEGYDKTWNIGSQNRASYTNVPHGDYTFKVKAFVGAKDLADEGIALSIRILPPPWKTWWAYLFYTLAIAAAAIFAVKLIFLFAKLRSDTKMQENMSEMKLQFFTNISHELRTPLTLILAGITEAKKSKSLSKRAESNLLLAEKNSKRMLIQINQLLDFRKCIKDKMKLKISRIDIVPIVEQVVDNFRELAHSRQMELVFAVSQRSMLLFVDAERFETVIYNLLSNAFKFTQNKGKVTVSLSYRAQEGITTIIVEDTGIGISKEQQSKLFERFAISTRALRVENQGSGIGLALCKEILELHHGSISAVNNDCKGASFIVTLKNGSSHFNMSQVAFENREDIEPVDYYVSDFVDVDLDEREANLADANAPLILVVEDNHDLRVFLNNQLSEMYRVALANDGEQALELLLKEQPEVIVTDLMMPNMDGIELTEKVRSNFETSHIPIIMLTAKYDPHSRIKAMQYGADAYITKPFSLELLMARIDNLMQRRRAIFERFSIDTARNNKLSVKPKDIVVTNRDEEFLHKLINWVDDNLENSEMSVDQISAYMGLGRTTMYNKVKSLTGKSPIELIREYKINKSKLYLESGQYSISEAGYKVGFSEPSYFSRCFKDLNGLTPLEYLKKNNLKQK